MRFASIGLDVGGEGTAGEGDAIDINIAHVLHDGGVG